MDRNSYDKNRKFLHLRQEGKLDLARLFEAGVLESKRGYTPEEFKFLINTLHIDPENGLPYKIVSIGVHRKKLVTVQRQLVNIQSGRTLQQTDVVLTALASFHSGSRRSQRSRKAHNGQGGAVKEKNLARKRSLTVR